MLLGKDTKRYYLYASLSKKVIMALFSKEKKIKTSITIDPLIHNTLKKISKKNGRTVSNYIEMLVKNHLEDLQKGKQKEIK